MALAMGKLGFVLCLNIIWAIIHCLKMSLDDFCYNVGSIAGCNKININNWHKDTDDYEVWIK